MKLIGKMKRMSFILLLALLSAFSFEAKGQDTEQMIQIPLPQWLEIKGSTLSKDSILVGEQVVWSTRMALPQQQELVFFLQVLTEKVLTMVR